MPGKQQTAWLGSPACWYQLGDSNLGVSTVAIEVHYYYQDRATHGVSS